MAKRGETRPYRITYAWPNGVRGTETRGTLDGAQFFAQGIAEHAARVSSHVDITITHRDTGESFPIV